MAGPIHVRVFARREGLFSYGGHVEIQNGGKPFTLYPQGGSWREYVDDVVSRLEVAHRIYDIEGKRRVVEVVPTDVPLGKMMELRSAAERAF